MNEGKLPTIQIECEFDSVYQVNDFCTAIKKSISRQNDTYQLATVINQLKPNVTQPKLTL